MPGQWCRSEYKPGYENQRDQGVSSDFKPKVWEPGASVSGEDGCPRATRDSSLPAYIFCHTQALNKLDHAHTTSWRHICYSEFKC